MRLSIKHTKRIGAGVLMPVLASVMFFQSSSQTSSGAGVDAAATYKAKCAACHGADGSGNTPAGKGLKARDLRSAEVQGQSDAQLLAIISKGKGKMPAFEKTLGADTCKELVTYVRSLKK